MTRDLSYLFPPQYTREELEARVLEIMDERERAKTQSTRAIPVMESKRPAKKLIKVPKRGEAPGKRLT